ncbi:hypothetical protein SCH01S_21_01080 [Sphingomonas changbaiensis NBRC 104936]|uniref:Uncharacterized protein n=1 Tax=Sphingomonas changbaiensis NBRC 104936 TaxID=1219043 RepID=A0A0E9MND4_9SPHN|nr:hypothetical protein SCH01S_21_01080 [Sphingomonas changbaiensis NBRC 104936]
MRVWALTLAALRSGPLTPLALRASRPLPEGRGAGLLTTYHGRANVRWLTMLDRFIRRKTHSRVRGNDR